jgi:DNA primase
MRIDVTKLLDTLKVDYLPAGGHNVRIKCINPYHDDKDPSLHVHTTTGALHCFSCGYKGYVTELIRQNLTITDEMEILLFLHQFASGFGSTFNRAEYKKAQIAPEEIDKSIKFPKHRSAVDNPYLLKRGFSNKEITEWQMGVINDSEYMRNNGWIYVPITQDGELGNYFMRNPFGKDKLYGPYPKKQFLVGIDVDTKDTIYVLEGIFKMIAFRRTRAFAVSSLGNRLSADQLKLLKQFKKVVIVPDNDTAGFVLVKSALPLMYSVDLRVCTLPLSKKDADECTLDELLFSQLNELPIQDYLSKKLIKTA